MKIKKNIALCTGLIIGLSNFSLEASLSEKCAEWLFKKAVQNMQNQKNINDFHSLALLANTASKVTLGISGFLTATSLLITYKKILSEGKSGEWKRTKITTGIIITLGCGTVAGLSYFGGKVTEKLGDWTSSKIKFGKKCASLVIDNILS